MLYWYVLNQPVVQILLVCRAVTGVCAAVPGHSSHFLYSVGADGSICTIDVVSGQLKHRFKAGKQPITCVHAAQGALPSLACCWLRLYQPHCSAVLDSTEGMPCLQGQSGYL